MGRTEAEDACYQVASRRAPRATPIVLQMEAAECGAAALGIMLAHHRRVVPLTDLRADCGVSRDGANAARILQAARQYDLDGTGYGMELAELAAIDHPVIVFWSFQHFLVVEGFRRHRGRVLVHLNDPASGRRQVPFSEIDRHFTGVVLDLQPTADFTTGGRHGRSMAKLRDRWSPSGRAAALAVLAGLVLAVPVLAVPLLTRLYFDTAYGTPGWAKLLPLVLGMLFSVLATAVLSAVQLRNLSLVASRLGLSATTRVLYHLLRLPTRFFTQRRPADLTRRVSSSDDIAQLLGMELPKAGVNLFIVLLGGALLIWQDALLGIMTLLIALTNVVILQAVVRRRLESVAALQASEAALATRTLQSLRTIETLKAGGAEQTAFSQWAGTLTHAASQNQQLGRPTALVTVIPQLLVTVNTALVVTIGGLRVVSGLLTVGTLFAFQTLLGAFNRPITEVTGQAARLQMLSVQIDRLYDAEHHQVDPAYTASGTSGALQGELRFDAVGFSFPGSSSPTLQDIDFSLMPGKRLAVVGASGSGKSTVGQLAAGLLHATTGQVLLDDRPRSGWSRQTLAAHTGYVDQEISLFHGSLRENVSLWDPAMDEETLISALRDAEILAEINRRAGGLNALVQEEGRNFSGGQRQRLEIARALAVQPALLILDEATSALDAVTEYAIIDNLRRRGCAVLLIAHRLSTVRDADEILVLDNGRILERGTHDELLDAAGRYAQLVAGGNLQDQADRSPAVERASS